MGRPIVVVQLVVRVAVGRLLPLWIAPAVCSDLFLDHLGRRCPCVALASEAVLALSVAPGRVEPEAPREVLEAAPVLQTVLAARENCMRECLRQHAAAIGLCEKAGTHRPRAR